MRVDQHVREGTNFRGRILVLRTVLVQFDPALRPYFPVTVVESCAKAHERYDKELVALRQHLEKMGVHAENGRAIVPH